MSGPSTSADAEVSETCRCGAACSVKAPSISAARSAIEDWRRKHPCTTPTQHDQGRRSGATTTFLGGSSVGFDIRA